MSRANVPAVPCAPHSVSTALSQPPTSPRLERCPQLLFGMFLWDLEAKIADFIVSVAQSCSSCQEQVFKAVVCSSSRVSTWYLLALGPPLPKLLLQPLFKMGRPRLSVGIGVLSFGGRVGNVLAW